ncbi:MAG: cell division protein ZipA, partial [Moraxellaceae bacterium]
EEKLASHYAGGDTGAKASRKNKSKKSTQTNNQTQDDEMPIHVDGLEEVIVLNLMAKPGEAFDGVELDRALTSCGFRFGDMNIYHRYEQHIGRGPLLFSIANVVEPGTFDPDNLEVFSTPGVCMFMKLPGPKRSVHSFELMVECGRKIVSLLNGDMKDEHHSIMTQQTVEHYRQRVLDFDRKLLSHRVTQRS